IPCSCCTSTVTCCCNGNPARSRYLATCASACGAATGTTPTRCRRANLRSAIWRSFAPCCRASREPRAVGQCSPAQLHFDARRACASAIEKIDQQQQRTRPAHHRLRGSQAAATPAVGTPAVDLQHVQHRDVAQRIDDAVASAAALAGIAEEFEHHRREHRVAAAYREQIQQYAAVIGARACRSEPQHGSARAVHQRHRHIEKRHLHAGFEQRHRGRAGGHHDAPQQAVDPRQYGVDGDHVAWINGLLGGVMMAAGSAAMSLLKTRMQVPLLYMTVALVNCACAAVLWLGPASPGTYYSGVLLYLFTVGSCYAMFTAVVLEFLGDSGKSGSGRYSIINSLGNIPVLYMLQVDGWGADRWGGRGLAATEAVVGGAGALLLLIYFLFRGRARAPIVEVPLAG